MVYDSTISDQYDEFMAKVEEFFAMRVGNLTRKLLLSKLLAFN